MRDKTRGGLIDPARSRSFTVCNLIKTLFIVYLGPVAPRIVPSSRVTLSFGFRAELGLGRRRASAASFFFLESTRLSFDPRMCVSNIPACTQEVSRDGDDRAMHSALVAADAGRGEARRRSRLRVGFPSHSSRTHGKERVRRLSRRGRAGRWRRGTWARVAGRARP